MRWHRLVGIASAVLVEAATDATCTERDRLILATHDGAGRTALWSSDGTPASTRPAGDIGGWAIREVMHDMETHAGLAAILEGWRDDERRRDEALAAGDAAQAARLAPELRGFADRYRVAFATTLADRPEQEPGPGSVDREPGWSRVRDGVG